jgi:uncharacterized iron-regulated membrane protein
MKRWLLRLHRWSGLLIAAAVLIVGSTGALTAYQAEIDRWLNPDLLRIAPPRGTDAAGRAPTSETSRNQISFDALLQAAESVWPGMQATSVRLPQAPDESVEVSVAPPGAQDFSGHYVYVDGYRGDVLGSRPFAPDAMSRRGIVASLYQMHYSLAASRAGVWIVSAVAAIWIMTSLFGLALAWPRSWREWRRVARLRLQGNAAQFNLSLHRLVGLCAAPVLVIVLATGIALNLSPQATGLLQRFSPLTFEPALPAREPSAEPSVIAWQSAIDAARLAQPAARLYSAYFDPQRSIYVVRMREQGAIHRRGQLRVYVDAHDAQVLAIWNPRTGSAGDRLWAWQNPLHSGHAFSAVGRLLVCVSGIAALLFVVTGVPLWFARRPARRR